MTIENKKSPANGPLSDDRGVGARLPHAKTPKSPVKWQVKAPVRVGAGSSDLESPQVRIVNLTRPQYECLIELSGYQGPLPAFGRSVVIGYGLKIANNADLPKACEQGKAYAVEFNARSLGGALVRDALRGER